MNAVKITCYLDRDECQYCLGNSDNPGAWCAMYDRPCDDVHVDLLKEDGEE